MKEAIGTGKSIEEAVLDACAKLGVDRDDVGEGNMEILQTYNKGFLGFGATKAKVKLSIEVPGEEPAPAPAPAAFVPAASKEEKVADSAPAKTEKPAAVVLTPEQLKPVTDFLEGLFARMGLDGVQVSAAADEEGAVKVNLSGDNLGIVIGRRGETLDAIQYLTSLAVNRACGEYRRVTIDIEDYRAKREATLERLAKKLAGKAVKYRRNVTLEPMNSYERRIIHATLQQVEHVQTHSVGSEPGRKVVIVYTGPGAKRGGRPSGNRRRPNNNSYRRNPRPAAAEHNEN